MLSTAFKDPSSLKDFRVLACKKFSISCFNAPLSKNSCRLYSNKDVSNVKMIDIYSTSHQTGFDT